MHAAEIWPAADDGQASSYVNIALPAAPHRFELGGRRRAHPAEADDVECATHQLPQQPCAEISTAAFTCLCETANGVHADGSTYKQVA